MVQVILFKCEWTGLRIIFDNDSNGISIRYIKFGGIKCKIILRLNQMEK